MKSGTFVCLLVAVAVSVAVAGGYLYGRSEVSYERYDLVEQYQRHHQVESVQNPIASAMADGKLTNYEFEVILAAVNAQRLAEVKKKLTSSKLAVSDLQLELKEYSGWHQWFTAKDL